MQISVRTYSTKSTSWRTQHFKLNCSPASGNLAFAKRLCADIRAHPISMLAPPALRWTCSGGPFQPQLQVHAKWKGRSTHFGGSPGCDWPGGTALDAYWSATTSDAEALAKIEPRLGCDDNPTLLAKPTPLASAVACVHGLWTPRTARLIRQAKQREPLSVLTRAKVFPEQIGASQCKIRLPPLGSAPHTGLCGITITHGWSSPIVNFTVSWQTGKHAHRYRWRVSVSHGYARLLGTQGAAPPTFQAHGSPVPAWLRADEARLLRGFGSPTPTHISYIRYPTKIAVIWQFARTVICDSCSAPSNDSLPRGRILRASFDLSTHQMAGAPRDLSFRFCGKTPLPPLAACLKR
ncbi:MAG: hypothetical protein H0X39_13270 [Actinobacteria bacterium]|nr:hypothetical protein [Actinomycetota bacterium]